jgi:hypothetical protein
MIIINYNDNDPTVYPVIDWLHYLNFDFKIINQNQTFFEFKSLLISNINVDFNMFEEFNNSKIIYWNRRSMPLLYKFEINALGDGNRQKLNEFISTEFKFVNQAINLHFENESSLNKCADNDTNKINNLILAVECDLKIPSTIITNQKNVLLDFVKQKTKVITKAIDYKNFLNTKTEGSGLSTLITENDLIDLPELFIPSLFQEYINKKIEIRSFFLKSKFFSTAIFSQNDKLTNIDYRNYNYSKPNRTFSIFLFAIELLLLCYEFFLQKLVLQFTKPHCA